MSCLRRESRAVGCVVTYPICTTFPGCCASVIKTFVSRVVAITQNPICLFTYLFLVVLFKPIACRRLRNAIPHLSLFKQLLDKPRSFHLLHKTLIDETLGVCHGGLGILRRHVVEESFDPGGVGVRHVE